MGRTIQVLYVGETSATFDPQQLEQVGAPISVLVEPTISEALDRLSDDIDCVVCTPDLPVTGQDLHKQLRETSADFPIIFLVDEASNLSAEEMRTTVATDYLPYHPEIDMAAILATRIERTVAQNRARRRADEQERINSVIREVNGALIRADSAAEIERVVCDILSDADPYVTACIAGVDQETMRIEPRTWSGAAAGYFKDLDMTVAEDAPGRHAPGGRAYHDREIAVSQNISQDSRYEKWQDAATDRGFQALAVAPLEYETDLYGLLAVFADRPRAFDETEQALLVELGENIAHALNAQRLQTELKETNSRLEALFEQSPDMINVHDDEGNIIDPNPRLCEKTGYSTETLSSMKVWDLDQAINATEAQTLWETMEEGDTNRLEGEYQRTDGSTFPVEVHVRRVERGDDSRFVAISRDITDRKERERELQRNERRFKAMFNDPNILVGLVETNGMVIDINETAMKYIEPNRAAVVGEPFWETPWWPSELRSAIKANIEQAVDGDYVTYEADLTDSDGKPYSVVGVIRPVRNDDGEVVSLIVSARDITDRRKREHQLDAMDRVFRHNVHNDMSIILGAAETIAGQIGGEATEFVEMILESGQRLLEVTEKQREIVELLARDPAVTTVDVTRQVQQAVARVAEDHPDAEVKLTDTEPVWTQAIPQVDRAVEELIKNAVVHTERDSPTVDVDVTATPERVQVRVADSNRPIPEAERAILRGEAERGPLYHGSGMGLLLVNWIISASGGKITYEQTSPQGNSVTIILPVRQADDESYPVGRSADNSANNSPFTEL